MLCFLCLVEKVNTCRNIGVHKVPPIPPIASGNRTARLGRLPLQSFIKILLLLCFIIPRATCFVSTEWTRAANVAACRDSNDCRRASTLSSLAAAQKQDATIDLQSDETMFGRGEHHLSASLQDDDVVVYQTGTWLVDGVEVGQGTRAEYKISRVENVQIVWTHNCEHGVIRGILLDPVFDNDNDVMPSFQVTDKQIEFGPEQLLARIPVEWNDAFDEGQSLAAFDESMWK